MDKALNIELRDGNPGGYEKLYSLTSARLKNYCKLFLKEEALIEDMVQDAYVRLWEKRKLIHPDKSVESLLFTIVRNQCLNYLRDQKLAADHFSMDENPWSDLQHLYQIDFTGNEEKSLEEQLFEALKSAIDKLPERQKQILIKCKVEGCKQKEVADELGISLKAVEKSLAKSKNQLREALQSGCPGLTVLLAFLLE
ncbi:MAG: RNA polymerase sigma-70 factor [Prolixibacteraceae bacterium]|nr:RNA polymerase sigma-70 factor [Prolixibacteraceae bacterium]